VAEPAGATLRYRLLETIRLFAAERLAEAGDDRAATAAAAHCAHFLTVAEAAADHLTGPEQSSWLAPLDADQANLRSAAGYAAARPDGTAVVLRLGVALYRYWIAHSREQEASGLLVPALQRPDARADPGLFAAALVPPHSSLNSLTSPQHGTLLNKPSGSPASWATTGCSSSRLRHCAMYVSGPASQTQGALSARRLSGSPAGSATTTCWAGACSCIS
jgi:hypothetical protein